MAANPTRNRAAGYVVALMVIPGIAAASLTVSSSTSAAPTSITPVLPKILTPLSGGGLRGAKPICPANMAHVGHSCVDKYEASLVEVKDDGRGFRGDTAAVAVSPTRGGHGLPSMKSRAGQLGGDLSVTSAPGEGTTLRLSCTVDQKGA